MTLKSHIDTILPGDNVIIGLGDSFTQGMGAYSLETWASMKPNPSTYNISGQMFVDEQGKNNWVKQLRDNFFPSYKVFNLGVNGAGNRAAVKELHLNPLPKNLGNVIVILMSTSINRFDFLKSETITSGPENHQKWQTMWPVLSDRGPISNMEREYCNWLWSERTGSLEFLLNVAEAQTFCLANGYKFFFASAFDPLINRLFLERELRDYSNLIDIVNWNNFLCPQGFDHFMDYICSMENNPKFSKFIDGNSYFGSLEMPLKYITPCSHWTIEGNHEVAKKIYELIKNKI